MADDGRDERGRRPFEDDRRTRFQGDGRRGTDSGYGYGYGGREGGQSRDFRDAGSGYVDHAGDAQRRHGGMHADRGPVSGDGYDGGGRWDRDNAPRDAFMGGREMGERRGDPGFPSYGESVGYMDRGFEPERSGRGSTGYGRSSGGGGGDLGRDWGRTDGDRGFDRPDRGRSGGAGYGGAGQGPMGNADSTGREAGGVDHRGRGPKGWRRSDERIREDVHERLADDPHVDASDIEVSVENGEVTLSGTVDSRQARRRAEDCIETVSGVTHCQNNLRVAVPGQGSSWTGGQTASTDPAERGTNPQTGLTAGGAYSGLEGPNGDPANDGRQGQTNTSGLKTDLADRPRH